MMLLLPVKACEDATEEAVAAVTRATRVEARAAFAIELVVEMEEEEEERAWG